MYVYCVFAYFVDVKNKYLTFPVEWNKVEQNTEI